MGIGRWVGKEKGSYFQSNEKKVCEVISEVADVSPWQACMYNSRLLFIFVH